MLRNLLFCKCAKLFCGLEIPFLNLFLHSSFVLSFWVLLGLEDNPTTWSVQLSTHTVHCCCTAWLINHIRKVFVNSRLSRRFLWDLKVGWWLPDKMAVTTTDRMVATTTDKIIRLPGQKRWWLPLQNAWSLPNINSLCHLRITKTQHTTTAQQSHSTHKLLLYWMCSYTHFNVAESVSPLRIVSHGMVTAVYMYLKPQGHC